MADQHLWDFTSQRPGEGVASGTAVAESLLECVARMPNDAFVYKVEHHMRVSGHGYVEPGTCEYCGGKKEQKAA